MFSLFYIIWNEKSIPYHNVDSIWLNSSILDVIYTPSYRNVSKISFFPNFTQRTGIELLKHDSNGIEYKHIQAHQRKQDTNESLE